MSIPHPALLLPVRTADDLTERWALLAALGRDPEEPDDVRDPRDGDGSAGPDLWIQLLDAEGHQANALVVVDGLSEAPHPAFSRSLAGVLAHLLAEETAGVGSVAVALVPADAREVAAADLAWAQSLAEACREVHVELLGVHLVVGVDAHRVL